MEEEYYEEFETIQKTPEKIRRRPETSGDFLENVIRALTDQKAKDVFVVKVEQSEMMPYSHRVRKTHNCLFEHSRSSGSPRNSFRDETHQVSRQGIASIRVISPIISQVICSTFNSRQAAAISENLRDLLKIDGFDSSFSHAKRSTKRSNGWYVSEVERVQVLFDK